eukprot:12354376-Prorocentrum_lima.AAC.1
MLRHARPEAEESEEEVPEELRAKATRTQPTTRGSLNRWLLGDLRVRVGAAGEIAAASEDVAVQRC